jgi:hypothetical protein
MLTYNFIHPPATGNKCKRFLISTRWRPRRSIRSRSTKTTTIFCTVRPRHLPGTPASRRRLASHRRAACRDRRGTRPTRASPLPAPAGSKRPVRPTEKSTMPRRRGNSTPRPPPPRAAFDGHAAVDEFGFTSGGSAAAFGGGAEDEVRARDALSSSAHAGGSSLVGVTFVLAEEMSLIHKSKTNERSVKARGNLSVCARLDDAFSFADRRLIDISPRGVLRSFLQLEEPSDAYRSRRISCDVSFSDPKGQLGDISASKKQNHARQVNPVTFHLSMPKQNSEEDTWFGRPLIEYTCGDKLQPVPLVRGPRYSVVSVICLRPSILKSSIRTRLARSPQLFCASVEVLHDRCRITFELRVNPRNTKLLLNAAVLVHVPNEHDGGRSRVTARRTGHRRGERRRQLGRNHARTIVEAGRIVQRCRLRIRGNVPFRGRRGSSPGCDERARVGRRLSRLSAVRLRGEFA